LISHGAFRNDKKRESIVPETIKKRLESYPGWSDLVRLRKKNGPNVLSRSMTKCIDLSVNKLLTYTSLTQTLHNM